MNGSIFWGFVKGEEWKEWKGMEWCSIVGCGVVWCGMV